MDLDLSSEHQLLRQTIRDFMEKEVAPVIEEHEREHRFPVEVVRRHRSPAHQSANSRTGVSSSFFKAWTKLAASQPSTTR